MADEGSPAIGTKTNSNALASIGDETKQNLNPKMQVAPTNNIIDHIESDIIVAGESRIVTSTMRTKITNSSRLKEPVIAAAT